MGAVEEQAVEVEHPRSTPLIQTRPVSSPLPHTSETARGEVMSTLTHLTCFHLTAHTHTHTPTSQTHPFCS